LFNPPKKYDYPSIKRSYKLPEFDFIITEMEKISMEGGGGAKGITGGILPPRPYAGYTPVNNYYRYI